MKRRRFLQQLSYTLAALGVTEAGWLSLGNQYYQALAQPTGRKLALLIGINKYPQIPSLSGCVTDVELQREVLIHRFGFQSPDILTLTDEQADRQMMATAVVEHLQKQARPGDVVVFHFSGYGSCLQLETSSQTLYNALLPVDVINSQNDNIVNCLLEETLLSLLRTLDTNHVTAILDTSYKTNTNPPGRLQIRARPQLTASLSPTELDLHKQLHNGVTPSQSEAVILKAANDKQMAAETLLSGFSAGLFTYALTQYLWEATPTTTLHFSLSRTATTLQQLGGNQEPSILTSKKITAPTPLVQNLPGVVNQPAVGAVTAIEDDGKMAQLWLGGIPPQLLENYGINSGLMAADGEKNVQMVLRSRTGLVAKAQIISLDNSNQPSPSLQPGQLIQEVTRTLPHNLNLNLALDPRLERIERVDATSAFATVPHTLWVVAAEQPADYVFGKLPETNTKDIPNSTSTAVSASRYGLFSLTSELIPNTAGEPLEAVKLAVQRLIPKLQTLRAAKLWRLTTNDASSLLKIRASLEIVNGISRVVTQRETLRTLSSENLSKKLLNTPLAAIPTVPVGSRIQYRVNNQGDSPIYLMLVGLDSTSNPYALYPPALNPETDTSLPKPEFNHVVIAPGETRTVPQNAAGSEWLIREGAFYCETQLLFSTTPFSQALTALAASKHPSGKQETIKPLLNPWEVAQALLQDLHNASTVHLETTTPDTYTLNVNHWASLNFLYQVV